MAPQTRDRRIWEPPGEPEARRFTLWERMAHRQRRCDPAICRLCQAQLAGRSEPKREPR